MFPFRLSNFFSPLHFLTNFLENIPLLFSKKNVQKRVMLLYYVIMMQIFVRGKKSSEILKNVYLIHF